MFEPTVALDLSRFAWKRDLKDLTIYGTWIYNNDKEDTEPCLAIVPRYRTHGVRPVVIALSSIYKYDNARYMARMCRIYLNSLGFEDTMKNNYKLADLILEHIDDLVKMPPDPVQAVVIGEGIITNGAGRQKTVELLDHEQQKL